MEINRLFAHYNVIHELGRGGMGVVYKAYDTKLKRTVALKMILQTQNTMRFMVETSATAQLNHTNIVRLYEFGEIPQPFFTMEYIEGDTLKSLIKEKKVKHLFLLDVMIKVCDALAHAHKKKIIHRDIKPSNIMITKDGEPKIMDFGLAKLFDTTESSLSKTGDILGSILYMPPEQINGQATELSDIYSVGATMYEALTGKTVFDGGESYHSMFFKILKEEPIPPRKINPDISPYLEAVCLKCLDKNPKKRYSDIRQLSRELKNLKSNKTIIAKKYNFSHTLKNFFIRNTVICSSILVILLTLCIALALTLDALKYANQQKESAESALKEKEIEKEKVEQINQAITKFAENVLKSRYSTLLFEKNITEPLESVFSQLKTFRTADEYQFIRVVILSQSKDKETIKQAIEYFSNEIEKEASELLYVGRANLYFSQEKYDLSEKDYNMAISMNSKYEQAYLGRGNLYLEQKKYILAQQDYSMVIALDPENASAYSNRGLCYKYLNELESSLNDYNKSIEIDSNNSEAYRGRGNILRKFNRYKDALDDFDKSIEINPKYATAYDNRAALYHDDLKEYALAVKDWETAVRLGHSHKERLLNNIKVVKEKIGISLNQE